MPGEQLELSFAPEATFVVSRPEEIAMTEYVHPRRAAASRARRRRAPDRPRPARRLRRRRPRRRPTHRRAAVAQTLAKTLTFSNWPLYIDINEKTKTHPSLDAFTKNYGVKVKYVEDINDNDSFFGKIEGPLSQGQSIGRDIIVMTDSSGLPGRMIELGWLEKLDKSAIPNIKNLPAVAAAPELGPEPRVQPAVAVGHDRHRLRPEARRRRHHVGRPAAHRPEAQGQGDAADARWPTPSALVMLANGDDPTKVTDATFNKAIDEDAEGGRLGPGAPVHRQRLRAAAREGRRLGVLRLVGRHGAAAGRPPGPQVDPPRQRRDDLDRQHADPEGRQRLRGVGAT